jgi:Glycosyl hydrolase family 79 C-terminal beta domain
MLLVSEALGPSNASQVVDLGLNSGNQFTPGYAIYENGNPTKVLLLNYMADPSGGANTVVNILIGGGPNGPNTTPANVSVRYMAADTYVIFQYNRGLHISRAFFLSLTQKFNITWAGQGMGGIFESDGRLKGSRVTEIIQCDPNTGQNTIACPLWSGLAAGFISPYRLRYSLEGAFRRSCLPHL